MERNIFCRAQLSLLRNFWMDYEKLWKDNSEKEVTYPRINVQRPRVE